MIYRYKADALIKDGPHDQYDGYIDELAVYKTFTADSPREAVRLASNNSITGEAYCLIEEYFNPQYREWMETDQTYYAQDYYDL